MIGDTKDSRCLILGDFCDTRETQSNETFDHNNRGRAMCFRMLIRSDGSPTCLFICSESTLGSCFSVTSLRLASIASALALMPSLNLVLVLGDFCDYKRDPLSETL